MPIKPNLNIYIYIYIYIYSYWVFIGIYIYLGIQTVDIYERINIVCIFKQNGYTHVCG